MELFPITSAEKQEIYKIFNTNEKHTEESVEIIKEWLKKQPHLPQKLPYDNFIAQLLIYNKFSVEKTKLKIDAQFTLKTLHPYFMNILASETLLKPSENFAAVYPMPKLTPNYSRIIYFKIHNPNPDEFTIDKFFYLLFSFIELAIKYGVSSSNIIIMDYKYFGFEHFKKLDLNKFAKILDIIIKGYTSRIEHIALMNAPNFMYIIINVFKVIIKEKIMNRMVVHKTNSDLHKYVPVDCLPEELGGTLGPAGQFLSAIDRAYEDNHKFFMDSVNYKTDERLRIGKSKYATVEGIDGTFRKIEID